MERIVMSLEMGVVVEEEAQRVIDLHRRELFADTLIGEAEELRELAGGRFLVAGGDDCVNVVSQCQRPRQSHRTMKAPKAARM
jgi:hypothetical protein